MSDNLIELLTIAADIPPSRIQDDEECADSLTVLCGRAAEALASLQQRNLLFMQERDALRKALRESRVHVVSQNNAEGLLDGFKRKPRPTDELLVRIDALLADWMQKEIDQ